MKISDRRFDVVHISHSGAVMKRKRTLILCDGIIEKGGIRYHSVMLVFTVIIQGEYLSESQATAAGYNQRREDNQTKFSSALIKDQRRFLFN